MPFPTLTAGDSVLHGFVPPPQCRDDFFGWTAV